MRARIVVSVSSRGRSHFQVPVDPTARFLYVANRGSNDVSAYSIGSDGALTSVQGSSFAAPFQWR